MCAAVQISFPQRKHNGSVVICHLCRFLGDGRVSKVAPRQKESKLCGMAKTELSVIDGKAFLKWRAAFEFPNWDAYFPILLSVYFIYFVLLRLLVSTSFWISAKSTTPSAVSFFLLPPSLSPKNSNVYFLNNEVLLVKSIFAHSVIDASLSV